MFQKVRLIVVIAFLSLFSSSLMAATLVDINKADAATLAENLNGIGDAKAKAIVAYRALHGDFSTADELVKVKGIGVKLVDRNRELISVVGGMNSSSEKPGATKKAANAGSANAVLK